jgi:hypothetical protein
VAQVAVCSQTNTKHIITVWKEHTIVKIFNLLVHPVTSRLLKVKGTVPYVGLQGSLEIDFSLNSFVIVQIIPFNFATQFCYQSYRTLPNLTL